MPHGHAFVKGVTTPLIQKQQEQGHFETVEGLLNFTSDYGNHEGDLQLKNTYSNKPQGMYKIHN